MLQKKWKDLTFIGFDTETSGKYPLTAELCEIAAVKWRAGEIIGTFESLIKPNQVMSDEVIAIHHITNEMVADAPFVDEVIPKFHHFIQDAILIAHHAPFDLGFVGWEFDRLNLERPQLPVVCSSLLSRKVFPESGNHRLQTLIQFFNFEKGAAHRALDDTKACLQVGLKCFERLGDVDLETILQAQGGALTWERFSIRDRARGKPEIERLVKACLHREPVLMSYSGGSSPGKPRKILPEGLVPSLDGDFLAAYCYKDMKVKRFFVDQITKIEPASPVES